MDKVAACVLVAGSRGVKLIPTTGVASIGLACHRCSYRRNISHDTHIECINPPPRMSADRHGINEGWFIIPTNFDPVWSTSSCPNFERCVKDQSKAE